jgi:hypothetical protein
VKGEKVSVSFWGVEHSGEGEESQDAEGKVRYTFSREL